MVEPLALFAEVDELAKSGIEVGDRLIVSDKAHLIIPYHRDLDCGEEARRGDRKIGTTSRGIGRPTKTRSRGRGIRVGDLADAEALAQGVRDNVAVEIGSSRFDKGLESSAGPAARTGDSPCDPGSGTSR